MNGQVVTVNNDSYTYSNPFTVKIPFGTNYSLSVNKKSGYSIPNKVSYKANQKSRSVTLSYTLLPIGIYIFDMDRNFTSIGNWNKANNRNAVGVYLGTENTKIVIAPNSIAADEWGPNDYAVSGITANSQAKAKKNYSSKSNTDKIVASGNTYYAAQRCRGYKFINGEEGYLWAFGQLVDVFNNYHALSNALNLIGGNGLYDSTPYWSSTQYSSTYAWILKFSTGYVTIEDKTESCMVRAVFDFD